MQSVAKSAKMLHYVNYRMKVTIQDGRTLVGTLMAFDKHMNLVLGDCEESRRIKSKKAAGGSTCRLHAISLQCCDHLYFFRAPHASAGHGGGHGCARVVANPSHRVWLGLVCLPSLPSQRRRRRRSVCWD